MVTVMDDNGCAIMADNGPIMVDNGKEWLNSNE